MLKYNNKKEKFEVTIGDKTINYKKWTAKEQRDYLVLLEKTQGQEIDDMMVFNTLISPVIDEKTIVLTTNEQKLLLFEIRKKSIGETFKDIIECPKCKQETKVELEIDEVVRKFDKSNWGVAEKEGVKITFGDIKSNSERKKLKIKPNELIKYVYDDFYMHILEVEYEGEVYKPNKKIVENFFSDMPSDLSTFFFEEYEKMSDTLVLEYDFDCNCGHQEVVNYNQIPGLLWI